MRVAAAASGQAGWGCHEQAQRSLMVSSGAVLGLASTLRFGTVAAACRALLVSSDSTLFEIRNQTPLATRSAYPGIWFRLSRNVMCRVQSLSYTHSLILIYIFVFWQGSIFILKSLLLSLKHPPVGPFQTFKYIGSWTVGRSAVRGWR